MTSDRTMIVNLLRIVRKQKQELEQLKGAFMSLALALTAREPSLVPELQGNLKYFQELEKEELPDDVWKRDVWESFLTQKENEIVSGNDTIVH